jgi:hypothetical protein
MSLTLIAVAAWTVLLPAAILVLRLRALSRPEVPPPILLAVGNSIDPRQRQRLRRVGCQRIDAEPQRPGQGNGERRPRRTQG